MSETTVYLAHHGVKGQKWGYRKWQNSDGTLTPAGKEHYAKGAAGFHRKMREGRITKLSKRSASQTAWLNDPTVKARLANANSKNEKYRRRELEYKRLQDKADRAIFFQEHKQRKANRAYKRMTRANPAKSQKFIQKYSEVEYRHALTEKNLRRASESYIKRYGSEYYDAIRK